MFARERSLVLKKMWIRMVIVKYEWRGLAIAPVVCFVPFSAPISLWR